MVKRISVYVDGTNFYGDLTSINERICYFEGCASCVLLKKADEIRLIYKNITNKFFWREKKDGEKMK